MKRYFLLLAALYSLSAPLKASCCASGASGGAPRLAPFERGLFEISQDIKKPTGYFAEQGPWTGGRKYGVHPFLLHYEIQAMARLTPFFLPYVKIPFRTTIGVDGIGYGLSDIHAGARLPVTMEHFLPHWPALTILLSTQIPTGTNLESSPKINNEDVNGTGATALSMGVLLERSFSTVLWSLGYTYTFEPRIFLKDGFARGGRHAPTLAAMIPGGDNHSFSFGLSALFEEPLHVDAKRIRNSQKRKFSSNFSYVWKFHSHLSLTSSLGADVPLLGKNESTEVSLRIGMRMGVF